MSGHGDRRGQREPVGRRDRPRRPARDPRRRVGPLRDLAEGRRHRRPRLGRPHERVHGPEGAPRRLRRRRRGARRLALRGAAVRARRGRRARRRLHREGDARRAPGRSSRELLARAGIDADPPRVPPLRLGPPALQLPRRQRSGATDERATGQTAGTRACASRRPSTATRSPRSSAPRARASTTSAASAPSAASRTSTTCCSSARASRAIRSRATASAAPPTSTIGTRFAREPIELDIPITIAGMSFGALSAPGQGGARPRRDRGRHQHDDRRRRHDRGGARALEDARLPAAARRATG